MGRVDFHAGETGLFTEARSPCEALDNLFDHAGGHRVGRGEVLGHFAQVQRYG